MQHSYEGLDRVGGFDRVRLFAPLAHRDYRLLVGGMSVSLLGDGLFLVALAWQVYALSNAPTALASVGIAMTIPTIVCLLLGGAVSDTNLGGHELIDGTMIDQFTTVVPGTGSRCAIPGFYTVGTQVQFSLPPNIAQSRTADCGWIATTG